MPDWIKPPSPEEQERIDAASAAASRNAYSMIRRGIGVNRMQAEAQQAVQNGVDPVTARQNALLNNAHLIFSDHPEQINSILESRQAEAARQRALLQNQAHLAVTAQHYSNLAEEAKAKLAETAKYHADSLAQKKSDAEAKLKGTSMEPSIIPVENPLTGSKIAVLRRGPNSFEMVEPKTSKKMGEFDKAELKNIYKRIEALQVAHDAIAPEEGAVTKHPNTIKRMRLNQEMQQLRERAQAIEAKAMGDKSKPLEPAATTETAPAGEPSQSELKPIPQSEWKVDKTYRGKDGKLKTFKGMGKDGKPIWEDQ